ncbi:MAG: DUF308 domain-containing protein [Nocardioidaceae bacterium]|jgi:uncharacterized membrane protein HdeD (DUF308 family)|nr:DUF308 domain-containing protein [Nocardioidaceae bacterium]MDQ3324530.1 DUF6458 family protein [Actinomycetota bacterium]
MGIGVGVVLIVLGAIFAFALDFNLAGVEEYVLGWILILGGVLAIVLSLFQTAQKNRTHSTVEERRYDNRP